LRAQLQHFFVALVFRWRWGGPNACVSSVRFRAGIGSCVGFVLDGRRTVVPTAWQWAIAPTTMLSLLLTIPAASVGPANALPSHPCATSLPLSTGSRPCSWDPPSYGRIVVRVVVAAAASASSSPLYAYYRSNSTVLLLVFKPRSTFPLYAY
jgi:hypothetical protein